MWRPVHGRPNNVKNHQLRHQGDVITVEDVTGNYTLIGQTFFHPTELRFHEITLQDDRRIAFRRGDVLGLHFARYNPVTWSTIPCAESAQRYLVSRHGIAAPLKLGTTLRFDVEHGGVNSHSCRQYSFTAILSQSFSSFVEASAGLTQGVHYAFPTRVNVPQLSHNTTLLPLLITPRAPNS